MGDEIGKLQRYATVATIFTPNAPVDRLELLAGRTYQLLQVVNAVAQRGQHVILYGERGVGKTSFANVLAEFFTQHGPNRLTATRVACNSEDTFRALWARVYRELDAPNPYAEDWEGKHPDPEDVRYMLQRLPALPLIIIDELDRLEDDEALTLLADTIKTLSDNAVPATLLLVGVADSIDDLIGEHRSIDRALAQVPLQRMSRAELMQILDRTSRVDLEMKDETKEWLARLSEGLPHFTHLLALHACQRAILDDRSEVGAHDVDAAIREAVRTHTILSEYQTAVRSPRKDNLFEQVLTACALAPKSELGHFTAGGAREPMRRITGKDYDIPQYARHLKEFTEDIRGRVLQRTGASHRYFYRFENPLLQPFAILTAIAKGMLTADVLREFQPPEPEPTEPLPLF